MVEGVYQANIDQKIALYNQIGEDHLGKDLLQKTTNFVGRALSQIFSKDSSNRAVSNLIADIREKPEFGDKYADMAKAKLTSLVDRGKPLSGRVAAQVLSEIKIARSEELASKANIDINIDKYVESQAQELQGFVEDAFEEEQKGIGKGLMTHEDKEAIKEEALGRLKSKFTKSSPLPAQMKDEFTATAREQCRAKIREHNSTKIEEGLATLKDDIKIALKQSREDEIPISDAVVNRMKAKITDRLNIASAEANKLYASHDPAIKEMKNLVLESDLMAQLQTEQFLEDNPGIPSGARDMIQDIFTSIPYSTDNSLQEEALDLVKEQTSPPQGLPKGTRVVIDRSIPEHPEPVLSFDSTFIADPELFAQEFGETTTVSSNPFGTTILADQFVADLARAPVTIKGEGDGVLFDPQEARDAQNGLSKKETAPGTRLEEKFVQACGGAKNQARALSILLNQSFAGSVAVACVKDEFMPTTGGGSIVIGAGTDHGPFNVTSHGQGRYTVEYSGKLSAEMLTAASMTDMDIPIQMVQPKGRDIELELKATYDIDLSGAGENTTEKDLAELIRFKEGSPGVSLKFVDNMATRIHHQISGQNIDDRSALETRALAGDRNMVVGTSASDMFPGLLPSVDQESLNAGAKVKVEDFLANPPLTARAGLAKEIGISEDFMKDFNRGGVMVNGTKFGASTTNVSQEIIDQELQRFVDALGGPEQALTASKLLFQATDSISNTSHFMDTDEATGMALLEGFNKVNMQRKGPDDGVAVLTGSSRSITIGADKSAVLSFKHNMGDLDQVMYSSEVGIKLSSLTGDVQVEDVQVAMIFTSND
jgi:hypothetical protein